MTTRKLTGETINLVAGFTEPLDWEIVKKDGATALVLAAGDVVHFELYSAEGGALLRSIDDQTPTAGGSTLSIATRGDTPTNVPASGQVVLDEDDTLTYSGRKYYVMWFKDTADGNRKKIFRRGMINFFAR